MCKRSECICGASGKGYACVVRSFERCRGKPKRWSEWPEAVEEFRDVYEEQRPHEALQMRRPWHGVTHVVIQNVGRAVLLETA